MFAFECQKYIFSHLDLWRMLQFVLRFEFEQKQLPQAPPPPTLLSCSNHGNCKLVTFLSSGSDWLFIYC